MTKINHIHPVHPFFEQAVAEHREMSLASDRLELELASTEKPDVRRLQAILDRLTELRDRLARHFAQEENGGYLEEAMVQAPGVARQAMALQREHGELLDHLRRLLTDARQKEPQEAWNALREGYADFAKRMRRHEAEEYQLLERAFNEDMGMNP